MCGLVGYVVTKDTITAAEADKYGRFFRKALFLDTVRGFDSTGIARVDTDAEVTVYKKAMPAYDFLEHNTAQYHIAADTYVRCMLGHNRAATQGAINPKNAHPFTHGSITLMHNGTLVSSYGVGNKFSVDSENICYAISECDTYEEVKDVLEKLDGAYALVWYDESDCTVNFARNDERPFHYRATTTGIVYASEAWMIEGGMSEPFKAELTPTSPVKALEVGNWVSIGVHDGSVKSRKFKPDEGYSWGKYTTSGTGTGVTTSGSSSSTSASQFMDLKKGDTILVKYNSHGVVRNKDKPDIYTVYGQVATSADTEVPKSRVTITGINEDDYNQIVKGGLRYMVATYGGCYSSGSGLPSVWVEHGSMIPAYTEQQVKNKEVDDSDDAIAFKEVVGDDIPFDSGPGVYYNWRGEEITKAAMLNYCNDGCAWCSQPIDIDAEDYAWQGSYLFHTDCEMSYESSYEEEEK